MCPFARLCDLPPCHFRCELVCCLRCGCSSVFVRERLLQDACMLLQIRLHLLACDLEYESPRALPRHRHVYAYAHSHGGPTHLLWQACRPTPQPFGRMTGPFHIAQVSWPLLFSWLELLMLTQSFPEFAPVCLCPQTPSSVFGSSAEEPASREGLT